MAPFLDAPGRAAVVTDFDGTLSPIVDDPEAARPLPGAAQVLGRLADRFGLVAVVSGRPASFLLEHFGGRGVLLWGLYGLETVVDGRVVGDPDAEPWRRVVEEAAIAAEREGPADAFVERKGLAVTLHFRTAPAAEGPAHSWVRAVSASTGLAVHPARKSFELRPPIERDKGTVLDELLARMGAGVFLGDDRGDLAAFDALDRLAARGGRTLRVGVRSAEAPAELVARADVLVDGPPGALDLLERLAAPF